MENKYLEKIASLVRSSENVASRVGAVLESMMGKMKKNRIPVNEGNLKSMLKLRYDQGHGYPVKVNLMDDFKRSAENASGVLDRIYKTNRFTRNELRSVDGFQGIIGD